MTRSSWRTTCWLAWRWSERRLSCLGSRSLLPGASGFQTRAWPCLSQWRAVASGERSVLVYLRPLWLPWPVSLASGGQGCRSGPRVLNRGRALRQAVAHRRADRRQCRLSRRTRGLALLPRRFAQPPNKLLQADGRRSGRGRACVCPWNHATGSGFADGLVVFLDAAAAEQRYVGQTVEGPCAGRSRKSIAS